MQTMTYKASDQCGRTVERELPVVAWLTVGEGHTYTCTYECARWYTRIALKPGRYPVLDHGTQYPFSHNHCRYRVKIPGLVSGSDFTSLWGGVAIGDSKIDKDVGKEDQANISWSDYIFAEALMRGECGYGRLEIAEGFRVQHNFTADSGTKFYKLAKVR